MCYIYNFISFDEKEKIGDNGIHVRMVYPLAYIHRIPIGWI